MTRGAGEGFNKKPLDEKHSGEIARHLLNGI